MINLEFLVGVAGVYLCFLTWGITQERVSTTSYDGQKFKYFVLLNTIQSLFAFILGSIYSLRVKSVKMSRDLFFNYLRVSLIQSLASPFGYAALKHIDYPTIILGKSCKLVPVMLMNFILYRRTFPLYKYLTVVLISAGVSGFMLLHSQETQEKGSSLWGLFLLGINLILDGATNSTQDVIFHKFKVSGAHM
jgi:UDP-galactose transporter B1